MLRVDFYLNSSSAFLFAIPLLPLVQLTHHQPIMTEIETGVARSCAGGCLDCLGHSETLVLPEMGTNSQFPNLQTTTRLIIYTPGGGCEHRLTFAS